MTGSLLTSRRIFFYPNEGTLKFLCWYLNGRCVRKGGLGREYLEDVDGSWPETWMTGSFLMSWMMFFYPKEDMLEVGLEWGVFMGVLGGNWLFLTADLEDRVTQNVIDDKILTQGDILKVLWSYLHYKCVKIGSSFMVVLRGHWRFLTGCLDTRSYLMQLMTLFDPKDPILKVSACYLNVLWSYKWFWSQWPTSLL